MRVIWLLSMGAKVEGILLLVFLIGISLGLLIGKITENKWVIIFSAVLPVIFGVVAIIKLLINSWENLSFERPILVGIISLMICGILQSVNRIVFPFWAGVALVGGEKMDTHETIVTEETKVDTIKVCETNAEN